MWSGIVAATSSISSAADSEKWNPMQGSIFCAIFYFRPSRHLFPAFGTNAAWLRNLRSAFARLHKLDRFFAGDAFWCELEDAERRPMAMDLFSEMIV